MQRKKSGTGTPPALPSPSSIQSSVYHVTSKRRVRHGTLISAYLASLYYALAGERVVHWFSGRDCVCGKSYTDYGFCLLVVRRKGATQRSIRGKKKKEVKIT